MKADDHIKTFPPQSVIIKEGQTNDNVIYVLNEGTIGVFKGDDLIAEIKESGIFFGEMSALLSAPRTATVKAMTHVKVTAIPFDFDTLYSKFPAIAKKLMVTLARRLQEVTSRYDETRKRLQAIEKDLSRNVYTMEHEMESFLQELSHAEVDKAMARAAVNRQDDSQPKNAGEAAGSGQK
ncbi:MAG: Crp/Fnr family transcriptional regulator [Verrucomicrobiae bacterium]|nr:Crp/Fnr family transcriptional regulator [Verrucomicrobiae bacterium]